MKREKNVGVRLFKDRPVSLFLSPPQTRSSFQVAWYHRELISELAEHDL